jgi:lipoate-protein ligase A
MIRELSSYRDDSLDPFRNIGVEEFFLDSVRPGECRLYLWRNRNTVVIGRNQNCWKECRVKELEADGGHLARRLSGGGAVYHDEGNLNFTFLMPTADYDLERQSEVILRAVAALGIRAERTGRNDLTVDGRKFSGNAFCHRGAASYHHGTVLIRTDGAKVARYLSPPADKLASKGVASVRSRIVNLSELKPELNPELAAASLLSAFAEVYGLPAPRPVAAGEIDWADVEARRQRFASNEWRFDRAIPFQFEMERRFAWGSVAIRIDADSGRVAAAAVESDALDQDFILGLAESLRGQPFASAALAAAVAAKFAGQAERAMAVGDVLAWLGEQAF